MRETTNAGLETFLTEAKQWAMSDEDQRPLWLAFRRRPTDKLRLHLLRANTHKVCRIVLKEFKAQSPHLLDMIIDATEEVEKAIPRYDPEQGTPFGAYIRKAVLVQARRTSRRLTSPVRFAHTHGEVAVPGQADLDDVATEAANDPDPEEQASQAEVMADLKRAVDELQPLERKVFVFHALGKVPMSLEEIANHLKRTKAEVKAIWDAALLQVQGRMRRWHPEVAA